MKTYLCRHALIIWQELRDRRAMPGHEDLDPYRLAPVLASRFVLDLTASAIRSVETGTRVHARLPSFAQAPRACFSGSDGQAFEEIARIVAEEGQGAVLGAHAHDVMLEILLLPLTLHRFHGQRVLGVIADCNPYAKHGPAEPLAIGSCRFLSNALQDNSPEKSDFRSHANRALTAPEHSHSIAFSNDRQTLTPFPHTRLLQ